MPEFLDDQTWTFYIGTYTKRGGEGIYLCRIDRRSGALDTPRPVGHAKNPSFVALDSRRRFLYAVGEGGEGPQGSIAAFRIDPATGDLALLNRVGSGGRGPCHVSVDPSDRCVLAANYVSGSVAAFPVRNDGSLGEAGSVVQHTGNGPHKGRQEGPHAHSITPDPTGRYALAADLGIDKLMVYCLDPARATLRPAPEPFAAIHPGAGPRHLAFHPDGRRAYLINELDSTMTALRWNPDTGALDTTDTISTLPADFEGERWCADVHVSPDGTTVYGSNRGHDSIAAFRIDEANDSLAAMQFESTDGKTPRGFALTPDGRFLVAGNQDSDSLVVMAIDRATGRLELTDRRAQVPMPVCIKFA